MQQGEGRVEHPNPFRGGVYTLLVKLVFLLGWCLLNCIVPIKLLEALAAAAECQVWLQSQLRAGVPNAFCMRE